MLEGTLKIYRKCPQLLMLAERIANEICLQEPRSWRPGLVTERSFCQPETKKAGRPEGPAGFRKVRSVFSRAGRRL
jgi:hypothetical protein